MSIPHQNPEFSAGGSIDPLSKPLYGANFGQAISRFFRGYLRFRGRASRSEFWWATLFYYVVTTIPAIGLLASTFPIFQALLQAESLSSRQGKEQLEQAVVATMGGYFFWLLATVIVAFAFIVPVFSLGWRRLQDANLNGAFALLRLVVPFWTLVEGLLPTSPEGVRFDDDAEGAAARYRYLAERGQLAGYWPPQANQQPPYPPSAP